jgi:putative hydrolase of the HAD superfamily
MASERTVTAPSLNATRPRSLSDAEAWIFDLDNTLYPAAVNLFGEIDQRMRAFIADFLKLSDDDAHRLQKQYFEEYGTSLRGLMHRHGVDPAEFLAHVHDIDISVLEPEPALDAALSQLPGRKLIYTNASAHHAERVTRRLCIDHHFEAIFDIVEAGYTPKPAPEPYRQLVERFQLNPTATVMVEDIARNLRPAAELGMITVWIRSDGPIAAAGADGDWLDHVTEDLVAWLQTVIARR